MTPNGLRFWSALFALVAPSACVPDFEDNLSTISAPRLLAIQVEPAEVEEGKDVELRALVAAPPQQAAPVPAWSLCLTRKPLTELGPVSPECLTVSDDGTGKVAALGSGFEVAATVPDDACRLFGPARPEAKPGELPGRPVDPDLTGGYYQPAVAAVGESLSIGSVRLNCGLAEATRDEIQAYNAQYRVNENPAIAALTLEGDQPVALEPVADVTAPPSATVGPGAMVQLRAEWRECPSEATCGDGICAAFEDRSNCPDDCETPRGCGGAEPYVSFDAAAGVLLQRREGMRVAWYASGGVFEQEATARDEGDLANDSLNTWKTPREAGPVTLWLVLRDSRGGASFQSYHLEVQP